MENRTVRRYHPAAALFAVILTLGHAAAAQAQQAEPTAAQPTLAQEPLFITTHDGIRHPFSVEMARTPRQQEVGLMFRTAIPPTGGMLFVWPEPQRSEMWMKNCPVPEDMVFIGNDDRIEHIAENTVPYSLATIGSQGVARATLELQGGLAAKLGINVGDLVQSKSLGR